MTGAWGTGMWRDAVQGARLAQLGHRHSSMRKKKGKKFQVVTLRERNPEKKIHLAAAAAWTALLNKLFHFARIFKVVFSIKDLKLQIQYFPSRFAGICRLQAETSRKALTPWPTPDSSLKLKFLDPLLYRDPHQNSGPSSFLPLTQTCM